MNSYLPLVVFALVGVDTLLYVMTIHSHRRRFVRATEETTVTQQVSHRPVVIPFILDVRLHHLSVNMWTHQPGSHRRKVTPDCFLFFLSDFLLRCLP